MTSGSSQGLFVIVAVVIFGIFVLISYLLFRDNLKTGLGSIFEDSTNQAINNLENKSDRIILFENVSWNKDNFKTDSINLNRFKVSPYLSDSIDYIEGSELPLDVIWKKDYIKSTEDSNLELYADETNHTEHAKEIRIDLNSLEKGYEYKIQFTLKNIGSEAVKTLFSRPVIKNTSETRHLIVQDLGVGKTEKYSYTFPWEDIVYYKNSSRVLIGIPANNSGKIEISSVTLEQLEKVTF